ncbi:MAG: putative quinol monooxygenase [Candidatus Methanoculleus thermohydrogenotrophicum]|jgi:quinol monooxygenase YgiN
MSGKTPSNRCGVVHVVRELSVMVNEVDLSTPQKNHKCCQLAQGEESMITIIAKCSAKAGKSDELVKLARDLVKASRSEAGNVSYDFYADLADPTKFTFIEVWKDQAAIDFHNATPHFLGFVEKAEPLLAGPLDVALYQKLT